MGILSVNMEELDPVHEAAYSRARRVIADYKPLLEKYGVYTPESLEGNWKVALIKKHRDMATLRKLWGEDKTFRVYLRDKLAFHYGRPFVDKLIAVFLN